MRRTRLFLSRVLLGVWIALFGTFLWLLVVEARGGGLDVPFAGISIQAEANATVYLPNRIFTCTETDPPSRCQADLQGHSLVVTLEPLPDSSLSHCQAHYDGQPAVCEGVGADYAPIYSESFAITGLELSPKQLQSLRQQYWGTDLLLTLGEPNLLQISQWLSIVAGVIAGYCAWVYPSRLSKGLASVTWGFITYQWVWSRLASVPYATVTPYGVTSNAWDGVVDAGAIAVGGIVMLTVALLLRRRTNRATKVLVTLSSGLGAAWMAINLLVLMLLGSGFVD